MTVLDELIQRFARIGATEDGGVCRLTGTPFDKAARDLFSKEIVDRGLVARADAIGNMFGLALLAPDSPEVVLTGSHLDTQATGGRYDGALGVLAGLLAVQELRNRCLAHPGAARRNLAVVNWTNEEGARFQPSLTGSSVFVGALSLEQAYACPDDSGVRLGDALSAIGYQGSTPLEQRAVSYVELHVEQGDVLEQAGADIAAVSSAWMTRKISITFTGDYSHTGSTAMPRRRDALRAAARSIEALYQVVASDGRGAHASAARINVHPNSPNVVAGRVRVWFEIRHPEETVVAELAQGFLDRIQVESGQIGVGVSIDVDERRGGTELDQHGVARVLETASRLGFQAMTMQTIIGHDAMSMQKRMPSSLIFVPSRDGISHNPREFTSPEAIQKGYAVLTEHLWDLVTAQD